MKFVKITVVVSISFELSNILNTLKLKRRLLLIQLFKMIANLNNYTN